MIELGSATLPCWARRPGPAVIVTHAAIRPNFCHRQPLRRNEIHEKMFTKHGLNVSLAAFPSLIILTPSYSLAGVGAILGQCSRVRGFSEQVQSLREVVRRSSCSHLQVLSGLIDEKILGTEC